MEKQRGFDQLEAAIMSLRGTHQVADLMELICQEVPLNVDLASQDATKLMGKVVAYQVAILTASAFVMNDGKVSAGITKRH